MSRKLASIQRIWKIEPIEGADRIELAYILGWQCVVNKGQFYVGDLAVYFEIDSFLPIRPEFEFLRNSSYKNTDIMGEGFRLKTQKFRGQVSQGLLLPIVQFPEIPNDIKLEADVTELLGVRKWEIEERATTGGTIMGTLPYSIPHTDETRVQAMPNLINEFANIEYYISTKMDGSSHSISVDENGVHVTGHNYEYKDDGSSSFYNLVNERDYKTKIVALNDIINAISFYSKGSKKFTVVFAINNVKKSINGYIYEGERKDVSINVYSGSIAQFAGENSNVTVVPNKGKASTFKIK